eukprot:2199235-Rhodomonas_salina.2
MHLRQHAHLLASLLALAVQRRCYSLVQRRAAVGCLRAPHNEVVRSERKSVMCEAGEAVLRVGRGARRDQQRHSLCTPSCCQMERVPSCPPVLRLGSLLYSSSAAMLAGHSQCTWRGVRPVESTAVRMKSQCH